MRLFGQSRKKNSRKFVFSILHNLPSLDVEKVFYPPNCLGAVTIFCGPE
jgi:hypothetical protein